MRLLLLAFLLISIGCKMAEFHAIKAVQNPWGFTETMNPGTQQAIFAKGELLISADAETDFFIEPGIPPYEKHNAPLFLRDIDNTRPFTASVRLTPSHAVKYDAGMLFLYVDRDSWLKFAFESDERMLTRMVTVKTEKVSDDNNHDAVSAKQVFLKISSDTKVVGFYYSVDGQAWQLVRVFKNGYPKKLKLGIGAQSPMGKGCTVRFDKFQFEDKPVGDFRLGV